MTNKNKALFVILAVMILFSTGCGGKDYIKDENNKIVVNEETGQNLQKNILCKPTDEKLVETYEKYEDQLNTKLEDLPSCEEFKTNDIKYHSLWETIIVKPLAWLILIVGQFLGNYGVSVMVLGVLIRVLLLPLSKKTMSQSENMKKMQPEIQRLEKKYENKTDQASLMAKNQEQMLIYKKYNVNPIGGCLVSFIQIPLFFGFLQAINRVPAIFEGYLFGMKLGMTPWQGISNGQYIYISLIVLTCLTTYLTFRQTMKTQQTGGNDAMKQMNFMLQMMVVVITFASFSLPTAVAFYWIVTNGFMVLQNLLFKKLGERKANREEGIKPNKEKKPKKNK